MRCCDSGKLDVKKTNCQNPSISVRHATLEFIPSSTTPHYPARKRPNFVCILKDLGTSNGTFVNNLRARSYVPVHLNDGDLLRFGLGEVEYQFEFVCNRSEQNENDDETNSPPSRTSREEQEHLINELETVNRENGTLKQQIKTLEERIELEERQREDEAKRAQKSLEEINELTSRLCKNVLVEGTQEDNPLSQVDRIKKDLNFIQEHFLQLSEQLEKKQATISSLKIENRYVNLRSLLTQLAR
jgi:pSer/pThr/pTyr-binding forkhead associated (FHA) protein